MYSQTMHYQYHYHSSQNITQEQLQLPMLNETTMKTSNEQWQLTTVTVTR